ncbi:MAG: flagellar biosynthesis protein FlhF [Sulfobacillus acidophilus]|uniref:Flagellar biosynthesis protein FlhF n=1 Tax=Sulfobacillus acidophilus TaxID=53633 RepID=A0A2T2WM94_9FIRM|nr:MAG: flagellar biosynthesis protein FlhF [Sulfobacillus acidophilus]
MIVKRFVGKTAEEALARAKWELGDDAIILSSGKARDSWWKFWESGFQVLVATDYSRKNGATAAREAAPTVMEGQAPPVVQIGRIPESMPDPVATITTSSSTQDRLDQMMEMLEGFGQRLERIAFRDDDNRTDIYQWLVKRGVSEGWALKLAESAAQYRETRHATIGEAVRETFLERLLPPAPIALAEPATVLFIGPTGSGKTTTIAKLAAYCHLERQKSVLLISTDTFRVAAVEQLRTYAEIIGVPLQIALRPQDIPHILKDRQADVVLIDTAGHSLNHTLYMSEIRTIAELSHANDIELVLPATMDAELMCETALKFGQGLNPKVCMTKIDEIRNPGPMLTTALTLGWPLSYVTDGQNVPEDIQVAFPETLVNLLEGGDVDG